MSGTSRERSRHAVWAVPLLVALLTFIAFLPALQGGFVTWDDDKNFLDNPHYRGLGPTQLGWMWTTFHLGHYIPLSWMTLGLDYLLWGMNPAGYHLTNLLLHTANAAVLYFVARRILRLTGAVRSEHGQLALAIPAGFAALLFAIHPLRVESVAWVTERRDVLSGFFFFSCVLCYLRACDGGGRLRRWYWLAVAACACALLSKATAVTLPALLLILNVFPLRRLGARAGWWNESARRTYVELAPFALLAAATVITTFVALQPEAQLSVPGKLAVSAYSLGFYLWKTIAPVNLSPLYAMPPEVDPTKAVFLLSYGALVILTGLAWALRRRGPGVAVAWLAFVVILLPLLGLHQNGPQIAADRYTYSAAPVLAILAGAGFSSLRRLFTVAPLGIAAGVLLGLGALTWNQTRVWRDSTTLWAQVLRVEPDSPIARNNWANLLMRQDQVDSAIRHYTAAITRKPDYAEAHDNLGVALARQGRLPEAIERYQRALAINPAYGAAHSNWGAALARQGDLAGAIGHYRQALAVSQENADAHVNWGNALVRLEQPAEAIAHYREALRIRREHADAHHNWGVALARQGKLTEAITHFREALAIEPRHAEAREYLERANRLLERR